MHHLLILASQSGESNLQRQIGVHMTPNQGTVVVVAILIGLLLLGVRAIGRR